MSAVLPSDHLTIAQVAEELQCSQDTVRRLISRGTIRAYRFPGSRLIRIDRHELSRARKPVTHISAALGGDAE